MAEQSFSAAFAAARKEKGPGKTFTWKGKSYTTDRADDKPAGETVRPKARPAAPAKSPRPKPRSSKPRNVDSTGPAQPKQPAIEGNLKTKRATSVVATAKRGIASAEAKASRAGPKTGGAKAADKPILRSRGAPGVNIRGDGPSLGDMLKKAFGGKGGTSDKKKRK